MVEIFDNIGNDVKESVDFIWTTASQQDPIKASKFIDTCIKYLETRYTEEEMEFVHFYLKLQMEKIKNG